MKIMGALESRRAIREYRPDTVGQEVLQELVRAAASAPSHMNLQPWRFTVVNDRYEVSRMGAEATRYLRKQLSPASPFFSARQEIEVPNSMSFMGRRRWFSSAPPPKGRWQSRPVRWRPMP
jgi:nitroreductase